MSHNCKALVLRCMDFRIKLSDFAKRLEKIGYPEGTYDLVSMAGSGKDCLSCLPGESEFLLKQIGLSSKLHCISEVVLSIMTTAVPIVLPILKKNMKLKLVIWKKSLH